LRGQKGGGSAKGGADRRTFIIIITNFVDFVIMKLERVIALLAYVMGMLELLEGIKAGEMLEVITEWCGIPVRIKLTVKWVAVKDKVICFEIRDCKFKRIFCMSSEPIYSELLHLIEGGASCFNEGNSLSTGLTSGRSNPTR
jgi:hypothetical protein